MNFSEKMNLKKNLEKKLSKEEMEIVRRSFDVVGSIAILEIPRELKKKEKIIADEILNLHKNIKTVVKKEGAHKGVFRLQKAKHVSGEKTKETIHKENGVMIKLDIEKVYFSPRLSGERLRIAKQVKKGEKVLVMFSGCGPYPVVISKNSEAKEIIGIELNKKAHEYALTNSKLNKTKNVKLIHGNAKDSAKLAKGKFDRIVMPLPKNAKSFLKEATDLIKKKGIIHYYDFLDEQKIPEEGVKNIRNACEKAGKNFKLISVVKCGQLAPRAYRVCFDFQII